VEKRGTLSTMLRSFTSDTLLRSGKKNWEIAFEILMQLLLGMRHPEMISRNSEEVGTRIISCVREIHYV
jgi:hypothetical protein